MRYLIVLAAVAALIGGAVAVFTQSSQQPDAGADAPPAREVADANNAPADPSAPEAGDRREGVVAAPGAGALDDAARQAGPQREAQAPAAATEDAADRTAVAAAAQPPPTPAPDADGAEPQRAAQAAPAAAAGGAPLVVAAAPPAAAAAQPPPTPAPDADGAEPQRAAQAAPAAAAGGAPLVVAAAPPAAAAAQPPPTPAPDADGAEPQRAAQAAPAAAAAQPPPTPAPDADGAEPQRAAQAAPAAAAGGAPLVVAAAPPAAGQAREAVPVAAIDSRDPTFDVVRITRDGNAVIAGRAEPGAEVTVRDKGTTLGTATADPRGEWVLVPAEPLAPGATQLTIAAVVPGDETRLSNDVVILSIPRRDSLEAEEPAIAILSSRRPDRAARVLQGPLGPVLRADGGAGVGLDIVDYDERGNVVFAGRAEPNTLVRLYSDNELVGTAIADPGGDWQLTAERPIAPGDHDVRVDAVSDSGDVVGRVAMPFTRAELSSIALRDDRVIVQPGNSLWRIARATYGDGIRYTVIYAANRDQIRDPNLIYPGQIFSIPTTN